MPRKSRLIEAGTVYHVLNRGGGRRALFSTEADFQAFLQVMAEAFARFEVDLLAFCLMENHWHLLVRPRADEALARCIAWMTVTHARRHHAQHPRPGSGRLYQGRFRCFPVQSDAHFLLVARFIHGSPARAKLVGRVQDWRWTDLSRGAPPTAAWPTDRPRNWLALVNREMDEEERGLVERSLTRGTPLGSAQWARRIAARLDLTHTLHPLGRPRKPLGSLSQRQRQRRRREKEKREQKSK